MPTNSPAATSDGERVEQVTVTHARTRAAALLKGKSRQPGRLGLLGGLTSLTDCPASASGT
jgi:hypothetical protein